MRGILRALACRGVAEVKARPVIVTNSPHAPWEGGYRFGYIFPGEIQLEALPVVPGFPIVVAGGRRAL